MSPACWRTARAPSDSAKPRMFLRLSHSKRNIVSLGSATFWKKYPHLEPLSRRDSPFQNTAKNSSYQPEKRQQKPNAADPRQRLTPHPHHLRRRTLSQDISHHQSQTVSFNLSSTSMALRVIILLGSPTFSSANGVGTFFGFFRYQSTIPPSTSG